MIKVSIITLGCKVNQVESEQIGDALENLGFSVSMGLSESDIYIINTCAVTNEAERKSRNIITKVLKLNKNASIYVCGCSSENNADNFKKCDNVKKIIGTKNKIQLVNVIKDDFISEIKPFEPKNCDNIIRVSERTRADLWVQNGCNNFCTYCLIPYLRGREISFPLENVKKELSRLEKIASEIVITGINLSAYGKDLSDKNDGLIEIARLFRNSPSRFRFSSLEVNIISDEFLKELSSFDNFCEQFHLSLQSGSNNTLKSMNRHYTKEDYLEKVNLIRKYFPNAGITTDIIIGFPTESEEDFEESLEFVKTVNFSEMHIFPYSKRNGTVAEKFKMIAKNIPERVKKMTEIALKNKYDFINNNIGITHEVIIENQKNGYYLAHTKNFILCYIKSNETLKPNSKYNVKILSNFEDGAFAEIIK